MSGEAPSPTEWERIKMERLAAERDQYRAELAGVRNRLRDEIAGLTAEIEDQRAITRAVFADLNRTCEVIRDAISHLDAGEPGIARRALQAGLSPEGELA